MNVKNNVTVIAILIFSALTRNAAGVIQLGGTITTNGDLIYNDAVVLTNNTTLVSTGSGMIAFNSTVNGAYSLAINTAGSIVFNGTVGGANALSQLTATGGGTIWINGSMLKTTGSQAYNSAGVLGADAALTSTNSGISFNSTVSGDYVLTVNAHATTVFGGSVSVANLATDPAGTTQIGGSTMTTTGSQTYNDAVVLGADVAFASSSGDVSFNSTVNGTYSMTVNAVGTTTFHGAMGGVNALDSLAVAGAAQIYSNIVTIGSQAYNSAVVLGADVTLTTVSFSDILFNSTVNGAHALTINSGDGVVFGDAVGGVNALSSITAAALGTIRIQGATIATTGSQAYNTAVVLGRDVALNSTGAGIALNSTVNGTYSLAVNAPGATVFNGAVGGVNVLKSLAVAGTAQIDGAITTTGSQTYNAAAVLGANVTLTSTATGNIALNSTVNGAHSLAINAAGAIVFGDVVGGMNALSNLTTDAGRGIDINCSTISTIGSQAYNDAVVLGANVAFTSTGSGIAFNSTVDGTYSLTVDASGATVFNGAVGGVNVLSSLAVAGTAQIHGDIVTTGSQSYNNHVTLTGQTTLTADQVDFSDSAASSGSVAIAAALNNSGFIAVNGGTLSFMDVVSNSATIRANNGAVLNFGTNVFNSGVIDALAGNAILCGSFSNCGTFVEASSFLTTEISKVGNDILLAWSTMGGHEYVLQAAAPPSDGGWTNHFSDVSPVIAIAGQSLGVTNYLDVGSATNLHSRYYRIRLQL